MGLIFSKHSSQAQIQQAALTIDSIKDFENFTYKGDVHVRGDIGKHARVFIENGTLTVDGNVKDHATINLKGELTKVVCCGFFCTAEMSVNNYVPMRIKGNLGDHVQVSTSSIDIFIHGIAGICCVLNSQSGGIQIGDVGRQASIKTMSGNIITRNVGINSSLKTMSGNINVMDVGNGSNLKTMSGNIEADYIDNRVALKTMSGNIRINNANGFPQIKTMSGNISYAAQTVDGYQLNY